MLYLLDANVLIDANRDYYSIDRVLEFWDWLMDCGKKELVKIPIEIYEEISEGYSSEDEKSGKIDLLAKWAKESSIRDALLMNEDVNISLVRNVITRGYASDLTDSELVEIGRDPFLLAYALVSPKERCIVTTEHSKPSRQRANRHIPDVCKDLGLLSCDTYEFIRALNFRTSLSLSRKNVYGH